MKQREYSAISTRVKRVNHNLSVRTRPGTESRSIVSIHDREPSQRIVLVTLLFPYKTGGFTCSLCVKSVVGKINWVLGFIITIFGAPNMLGGLSSCKVSTLWLSIKPGKLT